MTGFVPIMWAVWGVMIAITLALKIYTGRLSRDEDDQLVLGPGIRPYQGRTGRYHGQSQQDRAFEKVMLWLGRGHDDRGHRYYVMDVLSQFK